MNTYHELLLYLLTLAIHDKEPIQELSSSINGEELYKLAVQQRVCPLVYSTIIKYPKEIKIEKQIMQGWKNSTIIRATQQLLMINELKTVFNLFLSNGIPVISLKGLTLKHLYPQPELREMGDLDLFIDEKDMERSIELLKTLGYHPKSLHLKNPNYMHIEMLKPGSFAVELHRTLWPLNTMKKRDNQSWYNHIWENKRRLEVDGIQFTALPLEDELINMVIHLAKHIMNYGSDLRHFCDIVLFLEAYWNILDLEYIDQTLNSMDLFLFFQYLLTTCRLFLGLKISINENIIDTNKCKLLIKDIFNYDMIHVTTEENECWMNLSVLYSFARNNQFLMPLAIIIEVVRQYVRKKRTFLDSVSYTNSSFKIFNMRISLLRSIGLLVRI